MRTWVVTAPPFCARPVWSSTLAPLPSRCAAMPISAPMVTTPVPPMPVIRMFQGWSRSAGSAGIGQGVEQSTRPSRPCACFSAAAVHGDEARAEAVDAGIVLVAVGLVDLALAAELGLHRQHRHAVGLHAAVAAAFADRRVDERRAWPDRASAALAPAALLGRAGLVVDQHADAGRLAQALLHRVEVARGRRTRRRCGNIAGLRPTCRCRRTSAR